MGITTLLKVAPTSNICKLLLISLTAICKFLVYSIGDYHIIDSNALNDRITSSELTLRSSRFRSDVIARDGPQCIFTATEAVACDAAHLIPKSKGDEVCIQHHCSLLLLNLSQYIRTVLEDRLNLYETRSNESNESALEPQTLGINSIENGMLLRKDLHARFGHGLCAFLKVCDTRHEFQYLLNLVISRLQTSHWTRPTSLTSLGLTQVQYQPFESHYII